MRKLRRILCLLVCTALLLASPLNAYAAGGEDILYITSLQSFLTFAENCRLDSYSQGLTVILCRDIDLTGTDFAGVPIFSGTFKGSGNRITGLSLDWEGSTVGLFRYLTAEAKVLDLTVEGTVAPAGSGSIAGGIAGSNAGLIENCHFNGQVSGIDSIGGLVGINELTGVIAGSSAAGSIHGSHFTGGIAGESYGVIRNCRNHAQINTTIEQNDVSLEDITLESITDTESAATVTDIGGICGTGTGVIRGCENHGHIGYRQIGYNIGGIAGSHSGYIEQCVNYGTIDGRKEVGGIVGHLEPAVSMLYSEDTLQTLQGQVDTMSSLTGSAAYHAQSGSAALNAQAEALEKQVEDARKAIELLIPDEEDPQLPDEDTLLAAQNALSSSLSGMTDTLNSMAATGESTITALSKDMQAITGQMDAIGGTLGAASENMGGSIADVSDADTDSDTSAKIFACANHGPVSGDWNVGGITGAMALENDLDPEADVQITGTSSLNFDMELRAVVRQCENSGAVQGNKQNVGGIVGWMSMGLVRESVSTGSIDAQAADYCGGIAGLSSGIIRLCGVKSGIQGESYVGGIAGAGSTVSGCYVMAQITAQSEKSGAILGDAADDSALEANYYLSIGADIGGVDGISYSAQAEPVDAESFFALENVPEDFRNMDLIFRFEDGSVKTLTLPYGTPMHPSLYPAIPEKQGYDGTWEGGLAPGSPIEFDTVFTAAYTGHLSTLESSTTGRDGLPAVLVQGEFLPDQSVTLDALEDTSAIEAWSVTLPESLVPMTLRWLLPEGHSADKVVLQARTGSGWTALPFTAEGSYLVFSAPSELTAIRLTQAPADYTPYIIAAAAAGAALLTIVTAVLIKKHSKKK